MMGYYEPDLVSARSFSTVRPSLREDAAKKRQTLKRTAIMIPKKVMNKFYQRLK